jgi:SAM-dependent methyltransferase
MDAAEYTNLEATERDHWYYAGKRHLVRHWINRVRAPAREEILLDCGAGTGRFAKEMEAFCRVLVLDDHAEALQLLRTRFKPEQILNLVRGEVPLPDASVDYVTALDVLEHVPDDRAVVRGFHRLLKPGGLAVVTVPASMALWSDWDVGLHHFRRYHRQQLKALFPDDQWELVHLNYTNVIVYPAVWLVRKWRALKGPRDRVGNRAVNAGARSEDKLPPAWLNELLRSLFVGMGRSSVPMPFGVSLILMARRRV